MITGRCKIVIVDDNPINLNLGKKLLRTFHEVFPVPSAARMFELLEDVAPDLILLDVEMPEMNGYEAIQALKREKRLRDIPVMFLTARTDEGSELKGFNLGAVDYVVKPFSVPLLLKRIETQLLLARQKKELLAQREELRNLNANLQQLVNQRTDQILELQTAVLETVAELMEFRDEKTGGHVARTQRYLELLGRRAFEKSLFHNNMMEWNQRYVYLSGQLHDVGKIGVPDTILNKPGKLTNDEFEIMKRHPVIGVDAIEKIEEKTKEHEFLQHAKIIAGTHHEKWDGTGYPLGLSGQNIPLEGRMMAIADVYDALISRRPYKEPLSVEEAAQIIIEESGTHFDPDLIEIFQELMAEFAEIAKEMTPPPPKS